MNKKWLKGLFGLLAGIVVFGTAVPVFAQVHDPDVSFSINQVEAYRNCLELNDQLYIFTEEVDYTTNPTYGTGIDSTFIMRLMNGAVELAATTPYPFFEDGYGLGIVALYFDAASAPAWNGAYTVELKGNPALHWLDDTATVAMQGAVWDDGGAQVDQTAAANNAAPNDMTLMPLLPAVNDAYYFGGDGMFDILTVNIGQQGNWTGTYTWEYWDGVEWAMLSGLNDNTIGFTVGVGHYDVTYDCPEDWQQSIVFGITAHWIRFRIVTYTPPLVAQPLGTQSWINPLATPVTSTMAFSLWFDDGTVGATTERLTTRLRSVAQTLENEWGGTWDLIETIAGVGRLTEEGEEYFTNVIPGLRSMCPDLFSDVLTSPDFVHTLVVGESYTEGVDTASVTFGNDWVAQTITPTTSYAITGCVLEMYRVGAPGNVTVAIRNTAAGLPTGADLVTGTFDGDALTTSQTGVWSEVSFTADRILTAGTTYAIVVSTGGGVADYVAWNRDSTGRLTTGQACSSATGGVVWAAIPGEDFMFTTRAREGFTLSYRQQLAGRLVDTPLDFTLMGTYLSLSRMWMSALIWCFIMVMVAIAVVRGAKSYKPAILVILIMLPIGALAGFIYLEVAIIGALLSGMGSVYVFFFSRAV